MGRRAKDPGDILERIAFNVRRVRKQRGWSQEVAAERADFTVRMISRIENAATDTQATTLGRLARGLGVDPRELVRALPPGATRGSRGHGR